jgi:hypothetical protein
MIRYLLRVPKEPWERPNRPRREVQVLMRADDPDQPGDVLIEGDRQDDAAVRETLFRWATGIREAKLEDPPTPRDLAAAMQSPAMQWFAPERLAGDELFEPPAQATLESLRRLGHDVAALFTGVLPRLPAYESEAFAQLIEQLRLILARSRALAESQHLPPDATSVVAAAANERLLTPGFGPERLDAIVKDAIAVLEYAVIEAPQSFEQVAAVLRALVAVLRAPEESDFRALVKALAAQWEGASRPERPVRD